MNLFNFMLDTSEKVDYDCPTLIEEVVMSTCFGTIQTAMSTKDFDDDSKLWQFTLDKSDLEYTCRLFNDMRRPTKGDNVLVFLMKDRNHATQVVFDADLAMLTRIQGA